MRKIRDKGIAKLAAAAERGAKHTSAGEWAIRRWLKYYPLTQEQAGFLVSLSSPEVRRILGEVQEYKEKMGWPQDTSPIMRGYWRELLEHHGYR